MPHKEIDFLLEIALRAVRSSRNTILGRHETIKDIGYLAIYAYTQMRDAQGISACIKDIKYAHSRIYAHAYLHTCMHTCIHACFLDKCINVLT